MSGRTRQQCYQSQDISRNGPQQQDLVTRLGQNVTAGSPFLQQEEKVGPLPFDEYIFLCSKVARMGHVEHLLQRDLIQSFEQLRFQQTKVAFVINYPHGRTAFPMVLMKFRRPTAKVWHLLFNVAS